MWFIIRDVLISIVTSSVIAAGGLVWASSRNGDVVRFFGGVSQAEFIAANKTKPNSDDAAMKYAGQNLPNSAVIAFDSDKCPVGWEPFSPAGGRFVVGSGSHTNKPLSVYGLRQVGGVEAVTLTIAQIPQHKHSYLATEKSGSGLEIDNMTKDISINGKTAETSPVGGGQAHENRPPFIALLFCKIL